MIRNGEKISLNSNYNSGGVAFMKGFAMVATFFGALFFLVAYVYKSPVHGLILFGLCVFVGLVVLATGMSRGTGQVQGSSILFKNLMSGKKYAINPKDMTRITLSKADTGYGISSIIGASQRIKRTTVEFRSGQKTVTLEFHNTKHWQFGSDISIADVLWIARDEAQKQSSM